MSCFGGPEEGMIHNTPLFKFCQRSIVFYRCKKYILNFLIQQRPIRSTGVRNYHTSKDLKRKKLFLHQISLLLSQDTPKVFFICTKSNSTNHAWLSNMIKWESISVNYGSVREIYVLAMSSSYWCKYRVWKTFYHCLVQHIVLYFRRN